MCCPSNSMLQVMPAGILYISEVAETKFRFSDQSFFFEKSSFVSRGTFLNTTGLAFSLGIAVAYLVTRIED